MSTALKPKRTVTPPPPDDPWYYGWRDVNITLPDGTTKHEQIPLTLEDALHPQEGDCIMEGHLHELMLNYLAAVFRHRLASDPHALVLSDTGVYWDHPDLDHHSPDVSVIFGVNRVTKDWSSFHVHDEGVWPHLIIEVVSPNTRPNDIEAKLEEYHLARVPFYFIFDRKRFTDPWKLLGYQWTPSEYVPLNPDSRGRMWLDALGIWISAEGQDIVCYDGKTNERIGDFTQNLDRLKKAETDLFEVSAVAETERQRADAEQQRAEAEKQAREIAEARTKELEAELARLRSQGS